MTFKTNTTEALDASYLSIRSRADVEHYFAKIRVTAKRLQEWMRRQIDLDPIELMQQIKFYSHGYHPIDHGRRLNVIEQVNQTWTFICALTAAGLLLDLHPDAHGYRLAPDANTSLELDIMSENSRLVGTKVFAVVDPQNNKKLLNDLIKMRGRSERHRYVFFMSPKFQTTQRLI